MKTTVSHATSTLLCKHARKSCACYHVPGGFQTFRFIAAAPNLKSTLHTFSIPTRGINQYRWRLMERRAVCESSATNYRHIIIWYVNAGSLSQPYAYTHARSPSPPPAPATHAYYARPAMCWYYLPLLVRQPHLLRKYCSWPCNWLRLWLLFFQTHGYRLVRQAAHTILWYKYSWSWYQKSV